MKANKHLLLWTSLGTLSLLGWAAFEENERQVVVPALDASDRCVSCHLGMAPGQTALKQHPVFAEHPDVVHDPASYGCVVCHGGQGRATTTADAHGNVPHWPEPMIPRRFAFAGCGSCHTHLAVPNSALLERGRTLFERYDCLACHVLDGRGGTLRPICLGSARRATTPTGTPNTGGGTRKRKTKRGAIPSGRSGTTTSSRYASCSPAAPALPAWWSPRRCSTASAVAAATSWAASAATTVPT
jgi:hypothetical protein